MKKYLNIILGCIIIGLSFNIFFIPYNLIPNGLLGLGALFSHLYPINPAFYIALTNIVLLLICIPFLGVDKTEKYLISSLLIPLVIFLSSKINYLIYFNNVELIIIAVIGAIAVSLGYSLIHKEDYSIGCFEIIQDIFNRDNIYENRIFSYLIELVIILLTIIIMGLEKAIYSIIIILIINYLSTKAKVGISSNKTFLIITKKEEEIKDYLINSLKYDYTEFNVKGGFTNQKNKIIMTVVDTKDYYRLKEGIALIDKDAFISILDNYESINKNVTISKEQ